MNYLAVKDLKAPRLVRETLAAYGTALVTNNGKPMAMLVDLAEGENPDQLADAIRLARAPGPLRPANDEPPQWNCNDDARRDQRRNSRLTRCAQEQPPCHSMIAAVFDTNIIISGVLSPEGIPGKLLNAILDGLCQPVVTDSIVAEYEDVLSRPKFRFPAFRIHPLLDAIRSRALFAPFAPVKHAEALPDPDDVIFLEAAFSLNVPIVTGNARHFPKSAVQRIPILSPTAFLAKLCE